MVLELMVDAWPGAALRAGRGGEVFQTHTTIPLSDLAHPITSFVRLSEQASVFQSKRSSFRESVHLPEKTFVVQSKCSAFVLYRKESRAGFISELTTRGVIRSLTVITEDFLENKQHRRAQTSETLEQRLHMCAGYHLFCFGLLE